MLDDPRFPQCPAPEPHHSDPTEATDGLEIRLLRLADPGPEIPADGSDRVKAAIRPSWRREVRSRSRRRVARWLTASAAAAAIVGAVGLALLDDRTRPVDLAPVATLAVVRGDVDLVPPTGETRRLSDRDAGAVVVAGSRIETNGGSRVAFELAGGASIRIDVSSELTIESDAVVALRRGAVYVDSEGHDDGAVEVRTSFGTAREIGTQFEVRRDDGLAVRVREGTVGLSRDAEEIEVPRGTELSIAADGSRTIAALPSYGAEWGWVQQVAPVFDLEGRTAGELLDWVSRETGLWITYTDAVVERTARTTVLHGSLDGVVPADAPALVLPSCGLAVDQGDGTLTVSSLNGLR
jgi:ferric-dicitrate binding protein FerR (iron transport regulator)